MQKLRSLTVLILILLSPLLARAQTQTANLLQSFTTITSSSNVGLSGTNTQFNMIQWWGFGTLSTCKVKLEQSATGTGIWSDLISEKVCTANGLASIPATPNYVRITVTDITGGGRIDVRYTGFNSSPLLTSTAGYTTVEDEGVAQTQRSTVNFTGSGVTCSDDGSVTVCDMSAAGGGGTPGGSDTQLQYNNSSSFGGVSKWTTNGTTTLTALATAILDMSAAASFKTPVSAGFTTSANGHLGYDSTAVQWKAWQNGADRFLLTGSSVGSSDGQIPIWNNSTKTFVPGDPLVQGTTAHDAVATSTNPVLVGGYAYGTIPGSVSTDGDAVRAWFTPSGAQNIVISDIDGAQVGALDLTDQTALATANVDANGDQNGIASNPFRVDPTGTTTQPVSSVDGGIVTIGAKADAKSTATDTTAITLMQVMKEISAMEQAPPSRAVTNAGTFAVQAAQSGTWNVTNVSGTVSLPTGASTEATLATLSLAQASTTSGQKGPLAQGAVSTSDPSYTNGQTSPLSLTTDGKLRVSASVSTGALAIKDASNNDTCVGYYATTPCLNMPTQNVTDGATGSAVPTWGTMVSGSDGTDLRALSVDSSGHLNVNATVSAGATTVKDASNVDTCVGYYATTPCLNMPTQNVTDGATGAAVSSWATQVAGVDGSGNLLALSNTASGLQVRQGTAANLNATVVGTGTFATQATLQTGSNQIGHLEANQSSNVAQINGVTPLMGNGASGTGAQRVTIANDSTGIIALTTGSSQIGHLEANQSVNVAQINGVTTTMGNGTSGTGVQRVTLASDSTGQVKATNLPTTVDVNNGTVSASTPRVTIASDSTGQIKATNFPTTLDTNNGTVSASSVRVTIASDSTGQVKATNFPTTVDTSTGAVGASTPRVTMGNGTGCYLQSAASTNATNCKNAAGVFYGVRGVNTTTTIYYLRMYNSSSAPTCSSATGFIETIPIPPGPASGNASGIMAVTPIPISYGTGISFCFTGGGSSTDNTNAATGVYIAIIYN